jgi:UDP-N-acetylmuramate dehydrogenase
MMQQQLPTPRGALTPNRPLDGLTWLRVGGPADWLFQPADAEDLAQFLRDLDPAVPVFPIGVGSNLIVRDGGIRGVVVRLGRGVNGIEIGNPQRFLAVFGNQRDAMHRGAGRACRAQGG